PATTTIDGGSSNADHLNATWYGNFNGQLSLSAFEFSTIQIDGDLKGTMTDTRPGDVQQVGVVGSVAPSGSLLAGSIGAMTVGKDIAGTVTSQSFITSLTVGSSSYAGSVTGTARVSAGSDITAMTVYGDVAGKVTAGGGLGAQRGGVLSGKGG